MKYGNYEKSHMKIADKKHDIHHAWLRLFRQTTRGICVRS